MSVLALGKFDALHCGHHSLVEAGKIHGSVALLNLDGMAEHFGWAPRLPLLDPVSRKEVLAQWEVTELHLPFSQVQQLSAKTFLQGLVADHGIKHIVCGENCAIGRDRQANADWLRQHAGDFGLGVTVMPLLRESEQIISSSQIRRDLSLGNIRAVNSALGRPYRLRGAVVQGDGRGRQIGVPTANVSGITNQLPDTGVYAAEAVLANGNRYRAAVNIGTVPTAGANRSLSVEAHLLDYSDDCYGQELALDLVERLRAERKFDSFDALCQQIYSDIADVRSL